MNKRLEDAISRILKLELRPEDLERFRKEFADEFANGESLPLLLELALENYYKKHDSDGVELVIALGLRLDIFIKSYNLVDILRRLVTNDWHFAHEDIVSALEMIGDEETLSALESASHSRPDYLNRVDGSQALTRKAIWAIWKVGTQKARRLLEKLSCDDDKTISMLATKQLKRGMTTDNYL